MRKLLFTGLLLLATAASHAAVVRPAPEFSFPAAGNRTQSLRSLRGQAVVLLISKTPDSRAFKKQLKYLKEIYQQFASKQVVFIAALGASAGPVRSDIPFVLAINGPAVAAAYGAPDGFAIVIIGKDGNLDYQTNKVCPPERVRDVIQNSFEVQEGARKDQ